MKCAVIIYHAEANKIYQTEWIRKCIDSLRNQSYKDFDVFELNYGGDAVFYYDGPELKKQISFKFKNHIHAMNEMFEAAFNEKGYDVVFNVNLDDYYAPERFQKQINAIKQGYNLVSSNFCYYNDLRGVFKKMDMSKFQSHIGIEFSKNHNVIAHPVVAMHKSFWALGLKYNDLIGYEDLDFWKRAFKKGAKFKILPDYLLFYRIHEKQITQTHKLK